MKKLITLILILALFLPAAALAADPDPIVGGWYVSFDYRDSPYKDPSIEGKDYMFYILFFQDDGLISGVSGEHLTESGLTANAAGLGKWSNENGVYTASIIGLGSINPVFDGDRLLVEMASSVYYSMRRLEIGSWYTDLVIRP